MTPYDAVPGALITVYLNGQPHSFGHGRTLEALLADLDVSTRATATAVNGLFVPRPQRGDCVLCEGDTVVLFQPIVGG